MQAGQCTGMPLLTCALYGCSLQVAATTVKDEEKGSSGGAERSKEDILSEIRRLQAEMNVLEDRVQVCAGNCMAFICCLPSCCCHQVPVGCTPH